MRSTGLSDVRLSRFSLGTVQFGLTYGINNRHGQVPPSAVREILSVAADSGVRLLDTARIYGSSEEAIGAALSDLDAVDAFTICTKLDLPEDFAELDDERVVALARESLYRSLEALRIDRIPLYLTHRLQYLKHHDGIIWRALEDERQKGVIGHLGASVNRSVDEAWIYLAEPSIDMLQIPFNVLDRRWDDSGFFAAAAESGVAVVSRSAYLQGLLLMEPKEAGARVAGAEPYVRAVREAAASTGMPVAELILRYVLGRREIDSTIVGADSVAQVKENIALSRKGPLDPDLAEELGRLAGAPEEIVSPSLWRIP